VVVQVITVLATPEQAETLSLASAQTTVQLALRNPMDKAISKTTGTSVGRLFNGGLAMGPNLPERPVRTAPVAPPAPKVAPKEPAFVMEIISGTSKKENKFETAGRAISDTHQWNLHLPAGRLDGAGSRTVGGRFGPGEPGTGRWAAHPSRYRRQAGSDGGKSLIIDSRSGSIRSRWPTAS